MMITRCPACGTMFNVVADQLKVSQGWVRCGQCADVFDASLHLQDVNEPPAGLQKSSAASAAGASPNDDAALPGQTSEDSLLKDDFEKSLREAVAATAAASAATRAAEEELLSLPAALAAAPDLASSSAAFPAPSSITSSITSPITATATSSGQLLNEEIDAEESAAAADGVSFVRRAKRRAFWEKRWVRAALVVLAILLLIGLLLQFVLQQKDHLVSIEPRLKPAVQALCGAFGCQLNPLKKIEAVVIDSSTFTKLGTDSYRLSFSIKNLGAVAVAMPSLEVTLTDTQDQAVVRRVLTPAQFGVNVGLLSAGADFQGAVTLDVSAPALPASLPRNGGSISSRVAGYRLLAFYP